MRNRIWIFRSVNYRTNRTTATDRFSFLCKLYSKIINSKNVETVILHKNNVKSIEY